MLSHTLTELSSEAFSSFLPDRSPPRKSQFKKHAQLCEVSAHDFLRTNRDDLGSQHMITEALEALRENQTKN